MRRKSTLCVFIFLLIFSECIGFRIWAAEELDSPRITISYTLLSAVLSAAAGFAVTAAISSLLKRFPFRNACPNHFPAGLGVFFILWAGIFLCYIPCFLAFYPGIFNNDMVWQWEMYTYQNYSTHHPLLHTLFASSVFEAGKKLFGSYNAGLAIHSLFQLLVLSASEAFALRALIKRGCTGRAICITGGFFALYPYLPVMGLSTTKDSLFGPMFLFLFVLLWEMLESRKWFSTKKLAAVFLLIVLSCMFRNNASHCYLLVAFFLAACWARGCFLHRARNQEAKLALLLTVGVITAQIGLALLAQALDAQKGKINEMFSVPCQQLARAYCFHEAEFSEEEKSWLFSYIPEENLEGYVYYISDPVKNALNDEKVKEAPLDFIRLWLHNARRFPREYAEAFLGNTLGVWYLTGDTGSNLPYDNRESFDAEHTFTEDSRLPGLQQVYRFFHYTNYEKYMPIVSVIFYTPFFDWMALFGFFVIIDRKKFYLMPLPILLLSYIFTILLAPCVPVRYLFNIILCAPVLVCAAMKPDNELLQKNTPPTAHGK